MALNVQQFRKRSFHMISSLSTNGLQSFASKQIYIIYNYFLLPETQLYEVSMKDDSSNGQGLILNWVTMLYTWIWQDPLPEHSLSATLLKQKKHFEIFTAL